MSTWIKGIGGYLPERVVTSEELEEMDFPAMRCTNI